MGRSGQDPGTAVGHLTHDRAASTTAAAGRGGCATFAAPGRGEQGLPDRARRGDRRRRPRRQHGPGHDGRRGRAGRARARTASRRCSSKVGMTLVSHRRRGERPAVRHVLPADGHARSGDTEPVDAARSSRRRCGPGSTASWPAARPRPATRRCTTRWRPPSTRSTRRWPAARRWPTALRAAARRPPRPAATRPIADARPQGPGQLPRRAQRRPPGPGRDHRRRCCSRAAPRRRVLSHDGAATGRPAASGIVVVSHSRALARAAVALAAEMLHGRPVRIEVAAGLDETTFGTDAVADQGRRSSEADGPRRRRRADGPRQRGAQRRAGPRPARRPDGPRPGRALPGAAGRGPGRRGGRRGRRRRPRPRSRPRPGPR